MPTASFLSILTLLFQLLQFARPIYSKIAEFYNGSELLFFARSFSDKRANPVVVSSAAQAASERS
jgi:hypothetical protein